MVRGLELCLFLLCCVPLCLCVKFRRTVTWLSYAWGASSVKSFHMGLVIFSLLASTQRQYCVTHTDTLTRRDSPHTRTQIFSGHMFSPFLSSSFLKKKVLSRSLVLAGSLACQTNCLLAWSALFFDPGANLVSIRVSVIIGGWRA